MQRDWYDTPLYYDIIFDADTPKDGTFLEAVYQTHSLGKGSKRVLEPACGSGRLVSEMGWRGWKVSGFDLSQPMLDYAADRLAQQGQKATLWQDRMESFTLPKKAQTFDLAHCLVSTFKYLLTEAHAVAHLRLVAEALRPGGIYVLGLHLTDYARAGCEHERWVGERDGVHVVCNTRDWPADPKTRLEDVRNRLSITKGGKKHTQETHWQFRTYSAAQMKTLLRKVPAFELVACHDFNHDISATRELDDSYPDVVLVLRKKAA